MKLFFKNDLVTLIQGDTMDVMRQMVKQSFTVDKVITSPPYNTGRNQLSQKSRNNYDGRYDIYQESKTNEEYTQWTLDLFNLFEQVLKKNGVILYNLSYGGENPNLMWLLIADIIKNSNFMVADSITWKKKSALPNNSSPNKLTRITEFIFVFCRKSEYNTFETNKTLKSVSFKGQKFYSNIFNFVEAKNNDGPNPLNKATYSSDLVIQLLNMYVKEDSIVYDPFNGTGTTTYACQLQGIKSIGSELSPAQCEDAKNRLLNQ